MPDQVNVDYRKPPREVFRDVALSIIRESQSLNIFVDTLQHAQGPNIPGLNTWVPDWSVVVETDLEGFAAEEPYQASRGSRAEVNVWDDGSLEVDAQFFAEIEELGIRKPTLAEGRDRYWPDGRYYPRRQGYNVLIDFVNIIESWKGIACKTQGVNTTLTDKYATGETILEALYSAIQNRGPPFADYTQAQLFDQWVRSIELMISIFKLYAGYVASWLPWPLVWIATAPFMVGVFVCVAYSLSRGEFTLDPPDPEPNASNQGWVPGRTNNGLLGLFPARDFHAPDTVPSVCGDSVVFFKGAARPYVVRNFNGRWKLIGDAYLHGVMHGAAFDQSKCVRVTLL